MKQPTKNKYQIRNGRVSVAWFAVDMADLLRSALEYAKEKNMPVEIWSNDYKNSRTTRYSNLECVVLPDGRCDNPRIMQVGGVWCACAYPDYDQMRPYGRAYAKDRYDNTGEDFCSIYRGWESQPEVANAEQTK